MTLLGVSCLSVSPLTHAISCLVSLNYREAGREVDSERKMTWQMKSDSEFPMILNCELCFPVNRDTYILVNKPYVSLRENTYWIQGNVGMYLIHFICNAHHQYGFGWAVLPDSISISTVVQFPYMQGYEMPAQEVMSLIQALGFPWPITDLGH